MSGWYWDQYWSIRRRRKSTKREAKFSDCIINYKEQIVMEIYGGSCLNLFSKISTLSSFKNSCMSCGI